MSGKIFISYRREDSRGVAGRIYDRLEAHFGHDRIFMDVDAIPPGFDFVKEIEHAVDRSEIFLVVIGPRWLTAIDNSGNRRLDNPDDFVRLEVAAALERNMRVIPVLIDGTPMPKSSELPDNLKVLTRRNAIEISHTRFNSDVERLMRALEVKDISNYNKKITRELPEEQVLSSKEAIKNDGRNNAPLAVNLIKVSLVRIIGFNIIGGTLGMTIGMLIIWGDFTNFQKFISFNIDVILMGSILGSISGGISGVTLGLLFRKYIENIDGKLQILIAAFGSVIGGFSTRLLFQDTIINYIVIISIQSLCICFAYFVYNFLLNKYKN